MQISNTPKQVQEKFAILAIQS